MSISRVSCLAFGLCLAVLRPAAAQAVNDVRLSVRIELARYLPGEPVTVLIDVQNVGQEILEYQPSGDGVNLTLVGVERRAVPDIGVCGISILEGRRIGGWIDHPPELAAGQMGTRRPQAADHALARLPPIVCGAGVGADRASR